MDVSSGLILPSFNESNRPIVSAWATLKKIQFFFEGLPKSARILEIGCGGSIIGPFLKANGWKNHFGLDIEPPADYLGDIKKYRSLGLKPESFDVVVAFEVIEHVDCIQECFELLVPGGILVATSPHPHFDWVCQIAEFLRLTQKRTSVHCNLTDFRKIPLFKTLRLKRFLVAAQWGVFQKPYA